MKKEEKTTATEARAIYEAPLRAKQKMNILDRMTETKLAEARRKDMMPKRAARSSAAYEENE